MGLKVGLTGKHSRTEITGHILRVEIFMNTSGVILQLPLIVCSELTSIDSLRTGQWTDIVDLYRVFPKLSDPFKHFSTAGCHVTLIRDLLGLLFR